MTDDDWAPPGEGTLAHRWWLPAAVIVSVVLLAYVTGKFVEAVGGPKRSEGQPGWQVIRPPHEVSALAIQGGTLWTGGQEGVFPIDMATGRAGAGLACDVPLRHVQALLADPSGVLWIGHMGGLSQFDGRRCVTLGEADGIPDKRVNALYADREGRLWAGTWGGAAVRDGDGWHVLAAPDGLADDMVNVILQDSNGGMWFGAYTAPRGGLSVCQDGRCQVFSIENGLPHNNVSALVEDDQGVVWAGTGFFDRGGAARFARAEGEWRLVQTLHAQDGLAGEKVRSIFQDRDGALWLGSEYDGLARLQEGRWQIFTEADGLSNAEVKVMLQDADGHLWIGTRDGVTRVSAEALDALGR